MTVLKDADAIVERLIFDYDEAVSALRGALEGFLGHGTPPDPAARAAGLFTYPELRLTYRPTGPPPRLARAYARFTEPGAYATTITRPRLFADYLREQISLLMADFEVEAEVVRSEREIPLPYVPAPALAQAAQFRRAAIPLKARRPVSQLSCHTGNNAA